MCLLRFIVLCSIAAGLCGAEGMPPGYFRGIMVSFEGSAATGTLTARSAGGDLFDCGYDGKSYLELAKQRITPVKLLAGDRLEVLVDLSGRGRTCYIRILHVLPAQQARPKAPKAVTRGVNPVTTFTMSGVVIRSGNGLITIRGRDEEETLLIRRDTRFLGNGARESSLPVNERVFVEAGRNLDGVLEAYQIVWGGIVTVR